MDLNHLKTFVIVADEKSITQAARRLFTTPSSISMHIKHLEDELGVQLFVRSTRGMQLTEKGQILLDRARHTLQSVQDLVNHATEIQANLMGEVTLGVNTSVAFLRIPALIDRIHAETPGITLNLVHAVSGRVIERVLAEQMTLGFVYGAVDDNRLHVEGLASVPLVVAAPAVWADALSGADWADLARYPWIGSTIDCPFHHIIDAEFERRNLEYRRVVKANDDASRADLVAAEVGLSLLDASEAESYAKRGKIIVVEGIALECDLSIICQTHHSYNPVVSSVFDGIRGLWAS